MFNIFFIFQNTKIDAPAPISLGARVSYLLSCVYHFITNEKKYQVFLNAFSIFFHKITEFLRFFFLRQQKREKHKRRTPLAFSLRLITFYACLLHVEKRFFACKQLFVQCPFAVFLDNTKLTFFCRFVQIRAVVAHDFIRHNV